MAKHRIARRRTVRKAALMGAATAGISTALVLGHATNTTAANYLVQLSNTVIGVGGLGDNTGDRVKNKLSATVVPPGYQYDGLQYDSNLNLAASRDAGVPVLNKAIVITHAGEPAIIVAGYSAGTLTVEQERRNLQSLDPSVAPSTDQLSFLQISSPFAPNGGIFQRLPFLAVPGIIDAMGGGQPTRYDTKYVLMEYDPYGDFPAYFNPISLLNTALGVRYSHPDPVYDAIDPATDPAYVTTVHNTAGGTDTYVMYYNPHLPLLGPVRELAGMLFLTPLTEPLLGAIEPLLRLVVDMGYTDRVNADPATPTTFSLFTPPEKFVEALAGIPGALGQGLANLLNGGQAPTTLPDPRGNLQTGTPAPPAPAEIRRSQPQLTLAGNPDPTPTPTATPDSSGPTASPSPSPSPSPSAAPSTAATPSPTGTPAPGPAADGLHPTVTSDGNKFTPGDTAPAAPTGGGGSTTTTTATTTTTTTTTTGDAPGGAAPGTDTGTDTGSATSAAA